MVNVKMYAWVQKANGEKTEWEKYGLNSVLDTVRAIGVNTMTKVFLKT